MNIGKVIIARFRQYNLMPFIRSSPPPPQYPQRKAFNSSLAAASAAKDPAKGGERFPCGFLAARSPAIGDQLPEGRMKLPLRDLWIPDARLPVGVIGDPGEPAPEKKAHRMIIIRRRKMRKHKRRKLRKRMKFVWAKKRRIRVAAREAAFSALVSGIVAEGESFSADSYLKDRISVVRWKAPASRVRGRIAPPWVIDEHVSQLRRKALLSKRVEECLKKHK